MNYRVCDVCQMRVPNNLYDVHMRVTHALASNAPLVSQPTNSANYDPFSSLVDFSALLMELRQHQATDLNDNSTTTFPPQSMQQPPSAPAINPTVLGISRLLELYSTIPTSSTPSTQPTHTNFLHNFDTISMNTSAPTLPSYRDVVEQPQSSSSSAFYTNQRDANIFSVPPTTSTFQYMSYTFNPTTQGFDYTSNTHAQQPHWFSTDPPTPPRQRQSHTQSPFNLTRLAPIALEMLAAFDESLFFDNYENNIRLAERVGVVEVGVDNIDTVSSVIPKEEVNSDDICTICLDKIIDKGNEGVRKLICSHTYCDGCITQWLAKSKKCPVCNIDLEDKLNELNSTHT